MIQLIGANDRMTSSSTTDTASQQAGKAKQWPQTAHEDNSLSGLRLMVKQFDSESASWDAEKVKVYRRAIVATAESLQVHYAQAGGINLNEAVKKAAQTKWNECHQIWERFGIQP